MQRSSLLIGFAFLLALGIAACDDPGAPAVPGGGGAIPPIPGTGGTGGAGATGGGAGGNSGTGGNAGQGGGAGGIGGAGGGAGAGGTGGMLVDGDCRNSTDLAELASLAPGNARTLAASVTVTEQCGTRFLDQAEFNTCVIEGIRTTLPNLSLACSTCYATLAWRSRPSCNLACMNDSCLPICLTCAGYESYLEELNLCTGTLPSDCPET